MTTVRLTIRLSEVDEGITSSKVKVVLARLDGIPFHTVLGGKLVELGLDDGRVLRVGQEGRVCASTEILLSLCFHTCGQAT
jgi:hypothetical protein